MPFFDYYEILESDPEATQEEIRRAYRRRVKEAHPDLHPEHEQDQTEEMRLLNEAYRTLSDPRRRSIYDVEWRNYYRARGESRRGEQCRISEQGTSVPRQSPLQSERALSIVLMVMLAVLALLLVMRVAGR